MPTCCLISILFLSLVVYPFWILNVENGHIQDVNVGGYASLNEKCWNSRRLKCLRTLCHCLVGSVREGKKLEFVQVHGRVRGLRWQRMGLISYLLEEQLESFRDKTFWATFWGSFSGKKLMFSFPHSCNCCVF